MNQEQLESMQERMKNMTPEQLKEFQKQNCIFCQIVSGKVQSKKVYEDDKVIAILDINPANPGHVLLLPKEHYSILPQMPSDLVGYIGIISKQLSHSLLKAFKVPGTNVFVANGVAAGQRAQHVMIHIIPRLEGDKLDLDLPERKINDSELKKLQKLLKPKVNKLFGLVSEEKEGVIEEDIEEVKPIKTKEIEAEIKVPSKVTDKKTKNKSVKKTTAKKTKKSDAAKPIDLDAVTRILEGGL